MELLLNLVWLALAVPALAICRRTSGFATAAFRNGRSQSLVLAACFLMLVFPVVSASDDLSVLGMEMEESDSSHLTIKKATGTISPWVSGPPLVAIASIVLVRPEPTLSEEVFELSPVVTCQVQAASGGCRAPPRPESSVFVASPTATQLT